MKARFYFWLSGKLPHSLIFYCGIRLWAKATSGEWGNTYPIDTTMNEALERWAKDHDFVKVEEK